MQTKLDSLKEALTNIGVGLSIALPAQMGYFWANNLEITVGQNLGLAAWMTLVSLTRSYSLRRWFNKKTVKSLNN